jgi:hypothetical protein
LGTVSTRLALRAEIRLWDFHEALVCASRVPATKSKRGAKLKHLRLPTTFPEVAPRRATIGLLSASNHGEKKSRRRHHTSRWDFDRGDPSQNVRAMVTSPGHAIR